MISRGFTHVNALGVSIMRQRAILRRIALTFVASGLVGSAAFVFTYHGLTGSYPPAGFLLVGEAEFTRQLSVPQPQQTMILRTEKGMNPRARELAKTAYEGVLAIAALIAAVPVFLYWIGVNETRHRTKEWLNQAVFNANNSAPRD